MDARAVAETAGIEVGRLNMWVQQKLIPGMNIGARGRQRDFNLDVATHIMLMGELTRFGISAPVASGIAAVARREESKFVIVTQPVTRLHPSEQGVAVTNTPTAFVKSEKQIPKMLVELRQKAEAEDKPAPTVFALVDVGTLSARMRAAHQEWERQEERDTKADD